MKDSPYSIGLFGDGCDCWQEVYVSNITHLNIALLNASIEKDTVWDDL